MAPNDQSRIQSIYCGIADGVGSGKLESAYFSNELTNECQNILNQQKQNIKKNTLDLHEMNSKNLSIQAYNNVKHRLTENESNIDINEFKGSSTLLVVNIKNDGQSVLLNSYNIGDCQYGIYRCVVDARDSYSDRYKYITYYKSNPQIMSFGVPRQLGIDINNRYNYSDINSGIYNYDITLESRDIIIIGSDGLWDNLWDKEIEKIIEECMDRLDINTDKYNLRRNSDKENEIDKLISNGYITQRIFSACKDKTSKQAFGIETPWSRYMTDQMEMVYSGGRIDDISCIVLLIH